MVAIARRLGDSGYVVHVAWALGMLVATIGTGVFILGEDAESARTSDVVGAAESTLVLGAQRHTVVVVAAALLVLWVLGVVSTCLVLRSSRNEAIAHRQAAMIDTLTGLANRSALYERGIEAIAAASRQDGEVGVVMIDLDRFKEVNDTGGHALGDRVLIEVSRRLLKVTRAGELAARVGGDEFAVLVPTVNSTRELEVVASRIRSVLDIPVRFKKAGDVHVSASVGTAWTRDDGASLAELFRVADNQMYSNKQRVRRLDVSIEAAKSTRQGSELEFEHDDCHRSRQGHHDDPHGQAKPY